jgi:hypothetical protein
MCAGVLAMWCMQCKAQSAGHGYAGAREGGRGQDNLRDILARVMNIRYTSQVSITSITRDTVKTVQSTYLWVVMVAVD